MTRARVKSLSWVIVRSRQGYERGDLKQMKSNFNPSPEKSDWDSRCLNSIRNQLARRNLPPAERVRLALLLKPKIEEEAKERMVKGKKDPTQKSAEGETRQEIAKIAGVSHDTVRKVEISSISYHLENHCQNSFKPCSIRCHSPFTATVGDKGFERYIPVWAEPRSRLTTHCRERFIKFNHGRDENGRNIKCQRDG
jgi:hypothetical protein